MPLVVAGLLPNVPPSPGASVSTPHPLPFGVRWIASLEICALRVAALPAITTRVTHPFRIHPPIKIRKAALVGSEPAGQRPRTALLPYERILSWLYVRGARGNKLRRALSSSYQVVRFPIMELVPDCRASASTVGTERFVLTQCFPLTIIISAELAI